jgi:hypothetical protein
VRTEWDDYEYGVWLWLRQKVPGTVLSDLDLAFLKSRYYLVVLEGDVEEHENCQGPDCTCYGDKSMSKDPA